MDDSTELGSERALASLYYCLVNGLEYDDEIRELATVAWRRLTASPWTGNPGAAADTQAYFQGFREFCQTSGPFRQLCGRWVAAFDSRGLALPGSDIREFLSEAISIQLHSPHLHHDFFCISSTFTEGGIMDFSITHPFAIDFWTIYLPTSGRGRVDTPTGSYVLRAGCVALLPPGCHAKVGRQPGTDSWHCAYLGFRSRPRWTELLNWAFPLQVPVLIAPEEFAERENFQLVFAELASTSYQRGDINEQLCFNLIASLLIRLNRHCRAAQGESFRPLDSRLGAAVNFILEHFDQPLSVDDISRQANMSPSRLGTLFRQRYGLGLIQWRDSLRLNMARDLLENTQFGVAEISLQVGWTDQLYFSRRFRKQYGLSPRNYRQRHS